MTHDPAATAPAREPAPERPVPSGAEIAVSLVLTVGLGVLALVAGFLALFLVMVSDGCHGGPDDPVLCSGGGQLAFFAGLLALWVVLAFAVVGALVMILLGRRRRRHVWFWPFAGLGVGALAVVAFVGLVALLAST